MRLAFLAAALAGMALLCQVQAADSPAQAQPQKQPPDAKVQGAGKAKTGGKARGARPDERERPRVPET
jgi:hypothetical protein